MSELTNLPLLPVKELVADRLKWRAIVPASVELLREPYGLEFLADQVRAMVEVHLLSREVHTETASVEVPASWFDHFKLAVLPDWLQRRFPPRFEHVTTVTKHYHNCPHIDVPRNGRLHYMWLALDDAELRRSIRDERPPT